MALDKAILHKKEHRKQYRDSRLFSYGCRNHGSCQWCEENRLHHVNKKSLTNEEKRAIMSYTKGVVEG